MLSYSQPSKIEARQRSLAHAVEILTTRRADAAVVPRDYVRRVQNHMTGRMGSYDASAASLLDASTISTWEAFWDANVQARSAGDLKVAYLAGPEPLNDFRVLVELGVHPFNIWAFESDNATYNAALKSVLDSEFPLLKLQRGSLDVFLRTAPIIFDIVYLDACGPLPSAGQQTLRSVVDVFRHHRLASPGVLITNFAAPDEGDPAISDAYADIVSLNLFPKAFVEPELDPDEDPEIAWNLTDGPIAHSFDAKDATAPQSSYFHEVRGNLPFYYGQYVTRQIFDIASFIAPWTSFANSESWKMYVDKSAVDLAKASIDFGVQGDDDDVSMLVSDTDRYSIGWTFAASRNGPMAPNVNYPIPEPGSAKLIDAWRKQLSGQPIPSVSAETAIIAYHVLRDEGGEFSPRFHAVLRRFDFMREMHFFCDVPNEEIVMLPAVAQYTRPMHYNVVETRRFRYVAKQTDMFLDVIPFDACRYLYDWLPSIDLVPNALQLQQFQLAFRFALDGIAKHTIRYNRDYFYGVHAVGVNYDGFEEKVLQPRIQL